MSKLGSLLIMMGVLSLGFGCNKEETPSEAPKYDPATDAAPSADTPATDVPETPAPESEPAPDPEPEPQAQKPPLPTPTPPTEGPSLGTPDKAAGAQAEKPSGGSGLFNAIGGAASRAANRTLQGDGGEKE